MNIRASDVAVTSTGVQRFPIRFDTWYRLLSSSLFIPPSDSYVELDGEDVVVRMAWAFRARFPRSTVASAALLKTKPMSRGVHGFAGRWLVNGSGDGILTLDLNPPQRGYTLGVPIRLRQLMVSVDDPGALTDALRPGPA
jgi:hypothetical protein